MTTAKKATKTVKASVGARTSTPAKEAAATRAEEAAATPTEEPKTITFLGRTMAVKLPTPDQIVAWESLLRRLKALDPETATGEQALKLLSRSNRIVDSLIVDDDDKEWLEDGRIDGTVTTENSQQIVLDALKAYEMDAPEPANRAARRARK